MKRIIIISICLIVTFLSCISCLTMMAIASATGSERNDSLGKDKAYFELTTFQKVSPYAALATTAHGDIVCVIAKFDPYYDGLYIEGNFIRKGTYTYYSTNGAERNVLVYAYKRDMKELQYEIDQFLNEKPDVVVDNKSPLTI